MQNFIMLLLSFSLLLRPYTQSKEDALLGTWKNDKQTIKITFYKQSGKFNARIAWTADALDKNGNTKVDSKNPDPAKRQQSIVGMTIITGLSFDGKGWTGGLIYLPARGLFANCSISLDAEGNIDIRGEKGWISSTRKWTR